MRISDWSSDVCSSDLSISHFQLFLQDLEFQTHWYPQIASRRTTRGHPNEIDPKIPELTPSEEEKGLNKSGIRIFRKINFSHEELEKYLFSLKNKALIWRSEEHTSELQSLMRISYAVFCLKKKKK